MDQLIQSLEFRVRGRSTERAARDFAKLPSMPSRAANGQNDIYPTSLSFSLEGPAMRLSLQQVTWLAVMTTLACATVKTRHDKRVLNRYTFTRPSDRFETRADVSPTKDQNAVVVSAVKVALCEKVEKALVEAYEIKETYDDDKLRESQETKGGSWTEEKVIESSACGTSPFAGAKIRVRGTKAVTEFTAGSTGLATIDLAALDRPDYLNVTKFSIAVGEDAAVAAPILDAAFAEWRREARPTRAQLRGLLLRKGFECKADQETVFGDTQSVCQRSPLYQSASVIFKGARDGDSITELGAILPMSGPENIRQRAVGFAALLLETMTADGKSQTETVLDALGQLTCAGSQSCETTIPVGSRHARLQKSTLGCCMLVIEAASDRAKTK